MTKKEFNQNIKEIWSDENRVKYLRKAREMFFKKLNDAQNNHTKVTMGVNDVDGTYDWYSGVTCCQFYIDKWGMSEWSDWDVSRVIEQKLERENWDLFGDGMFDKFEEQQYEKIEIETVNGNLIELFIYEYEVEGIWSKESYNPDNYEGDYNEFRINVDGYTDRVVSFYFK